MFRQANLCFEQNGSVALSRIFISTVFPSVWWTSYRKSVTYIANGNLIGGLDEILGDSAIDTIGLETAAVDVNHIHNARYSVQLSVVSVYACLIEAYKQNKSGLPLFDWAEVVAESNNMFRYWLLMLRFQIDYLILVCQRFKIFGKVVLHS